MKYLIATFLFLFHINVFAGGNIGSAMYWSGQAKDQQLDQQMKQEQIEAQRLQNQQMQNQNGTQQKRIDFQCVNDCTNKGYVLQLCQNKCSY